jgi:undecaprenyl-diphosphatase
MSQFILGETQPGRVDPERTPVASSRVLTSLILGLAIFAASAVIAFRQQAWEYQAIAALNRYAGRSLLLDRAIHALTARDLLQGVVFIAAIWYLWYDTKNPAARTRLVSGITAATAAGIFSRVLQLCLPTHPRPLHAVGFNVTLPIGVEPDALNHFNSFPSDHGAVWFALALVILRERTVPGALALAWAAVIDAARVYDLFHFPSDIAGSIGLALIALTLFDGAWMRRVAAHVITFAERHPAWFAMAAFVMTYQLATLFDDVRQIARGFAGAVLPHDPFIGH